VDYAYQQLGRVRPALAVQAIVTIPMGRGLGSSSSVIVGALRYVQAQHPELTEATLLTWATALEGHPDNVAPALRGGVQLCDGEQAYALPWPTDWQIVLAIPGETLMTRTARSVLPETYTGADAVFNLRKTGLLVHALHTGDADALAQALSDRLHQPYRAALIPDFEPMRTAAMAQGAMGCFISGAGPTIAIITSKTHVSQLRNILKAQFPRHGWLTPSLWIPATEAIAV
jgi:homoserine kinase